MSKDTGDNFWRKKYLFKLNPNQKEGGRNPEGNNPVRSSSLPDFSVEPDDRNAPSPLAKSVSVVDLLGGSPDDVERKSWESKLGSRLPERSGELDAIPEGNAENQRVSEGVWQRRNSREEGVFEME